jgi:hypothetical protein
MRAARHACHRIAVGGAYPSDPLSALTAVFEAVAVQQGTGQFQEPTEGNPEPASHLIDV